MRKRLRTREALIADAFQLARSLCRDPADIRRVEGGVKQAVWTLRAGDPDFPEELFTVSCFHPFPPATLEQHRESKN